MSLEEQLKAVRMEMDAKFAATVAKFRASTEKIKEARPATKVTDYVKPKNTETPAPAAAKRAAAAEKRANTPKCNARTLEGRQCPFSATCGLFCKKHFSML
jgi:hypothetical protein